MSRKSRRKRKQEDRPAKSPPTSPPAAPNDPPTRHLLRTNFSPEVCTAIVENVRSGLPYRHAAEKVGVAERTLYNWLTKGKAEDAGPYQQFVQDIKRAAAEFVSQCTAHIQAAAVDEWQAAAWLMERKHPDEFASERVRLKALEKQVEELTRRLADAEAARGLGTQNGVGGRGRADDGGGGDPST